jgi:hypothetical protein
MARPLPVVEPVGAALARDAALAAEGWTRRYMATMPRIEEGEELYRQLGFEVRLEHPVTDELREECGDCRLALELFRVLYTRKAP